jgi:hypothetical protein
MQKNRDEYLAFVENQARELGKEFIIDSGEGHDYLDQRTGWYIENLSGWLVDLEEADALKKSRRDGNTDKYSNWFVFVYWSFDDQGQLQIRFEKVPNDYDF